MKKKFVKSITLLLILTLAMLTLTACGQDSQNTAAEDSPAYDIVCVDYVTYDWCKALLGDNPAGIELELINDGSTDMHSFQPSVKDIAKLKNASVVIYTGGESEQWVTDALNDNSDAADTTVLNLFDLFLSSDFADDYEDNDDEHIWSSPTLAKYFTSLIFAVISEKLIDKNSSMYEENTEYYSETFGEYSSELDKLIDAFNALEVTKPIVLADRNPFNYLFEDCGIDCQAAFDGCSAETEASFECIIGLANVMDDNHLSCILYLDNGKEEVPELVKSVLGATESGENSSADRVPLYSMDSVLPESIPTDTGAYMGSEYLSAMWYNYDAISYALLNVWN